jgi:U4/U6.U5 tri-snRNP-associated protein 1
LDDKHSRGKGRERYLGGGGGLEFKEKDGYKPDIKLEYVDDSGRMMTPKEAFRFLSHKFHGKGSGKKKTEKRQKKVEEEMVRNERFALS